MNISLCKNESEANVVLKTLVSPLILQNAFARDVFDVENPVLTVESAQDISPYNYVYISDFNRYYFITESRIIRTGLWELRCRVDVLMSFSEEIFALSGIVERSAGLWDAYLPDDMGKIRQTTKIACKTFRDALNAPVVFTFSTEPILITAG